MNTQTTVEELQLPEGYGTATGSLRKYEIWKLKKADDEIVLRVLPLMKSLLTLDDFGAYWGLHYGWNGRDAKDPTKVAYHPFLCVEEKNYGMTVVECPACTYRNGKKKELDAAKIDMDNQVKTLTAKGQSLGKSESEINVAAGKLREKLFQNIKPLSEWMGDHGLDKKFRIPCINKQGQFGIFLAPWGVLQKLRKIMTDLKSQNYPGTDVAINAHGRKGVWMRITRTGQASTTSDDVTPCRITRAEDGASFLDFHVITNEQLQQAQQRLPDLLELKEQNRISLDKMQALVELDKQGGGSSDPLEVDRILEIGKKKEAANVEQEWADAPVVTQKVTTPIDPPVQKVEQVIEKPKTVETKPVETKPVVTGATGVVNGGTLTNDQFEDLWKD